MRHHRVDISPRNEESVSGNAKLFKISIAPPVGLSDNSHRKADILYHTGNYCNAEGGVVNIAVARNANKVKLLYPSLLHIFF